MTASSVYMVRVVDVNGVAYAELVNATVTSITWLLNGFGGATFSVPTTDPDADTLIMLQREVQIWRDPLDGSAPKLIFWGPMVRARATPDTVEVQAMSLLWYFSRLYFGPVLGEHMVNGDFETGTTTGWSFGGSPTVSIDTTIVRKGTYSLKLVSAAQHLDAYEFQQFNITGGTAPTGVLIAASFYQVATFATPYIGPAFEERGLYVKVTVSGATIAEVWTPLSEAAPRNTWGRIYAPLVVIPASTAAVVEVRCYSPGGEIHWDMVTAKTPESVGSSTGGGVTADLNFILNGVVGSMQDPALNHSDLNITPPAVSPPFGWVGTRIYQSTDLGNVWDVCMKELVASGICDLDVTWNTAGTTRQFVAYPSKGSVKPQLTLEMGGNVGDFTYEVDGQTTAGAVVVIPQQDHDEPVVGTVQPVASYVGYSVDPSANGGITMGSVVTASLETPPDGVALRAATELAKQKQLVVVPTVVVKENLGGALIGHLEVGDTIPVIIDYGFVDVNSPFRVTAMTLTPGDETLSVVCGPVLPGVPNMPPSPQAQVAAGQTAIANVVRQGATPAPSFAQLGATNLGYITNAQLPAYDQATGMLIAVNPFDVIFDLPGTVTVSTSPAVTPRDTINAVGLSVTLTTPGSSTTTVNLLKNGSVVATVSLAASATYNHVAISPAVGYTARTDTYAISVTAAGTGAVGLAGGIELG